jgi:hypothetical protein
MLAFGLIAPLSASAQQFYTSAPAGYQPAGAVPAASAPAPSQPAVGAMSTAAPTQAAAPAPAPAVVDASIPHVHKRGKICPACAAKQAGEMPPGQIVACAHSKNGVCSACAAAMNMPGTWVQAGAAPAPAVAAPGRAMAASNAEMDGMSDPAPVGVVQAGYSQSAGSMAMQAPMMAPGMQANAPGRAVAESTPGRELYQRPGNGGFPRPHILGHLFGWSGIGAERREERAFKKSEAHAMITYDPNAPTGVSELPASTVFGKQK